MPICTFDNYDEIRAFLRIFSKLKHQMYFHPPELWRDKNDEEKKLERAYSLLSDVGEFSDVGESWSAIFSWPAIGDFFFIGTGFTWPAIGEFSWHTRHWVSFHNVATIKGSQWTRHFSKNINVFQEASSHDVCRQEVDKREDVYITDI